MRNEILWVSAEVQAWYCINNNNKKKREKKKLLTEWIMKPNTRMYMAWVCICMYVCVCIYVGKKVKWSHCVDKKKTLHTMHSSTRLLNGVAVNDWLCCVLHKMPLQWATCLLQGWWQTDQESDEDCEYLCVDN